MKKILLSLFIFLLVSSFVKFADASLLDDLKKEVGELRAQIALLKGSQMATALSATNDTTPRIMYSWGLVNQHVDLNGVWQTDSDGSSGANLDKLTYCKKFWANTVSVEDYKNETIDTWRAAGNKGAYTGTKMSTKCVQSTGSKTDPINGGWSKWVDSGVCTNNQQKQVRTCTNPTPTNGGKTCSGDWYQYVSCGTLDTAPKLNSSVSLSEVCKTGFPDFEYLKTNRGSVVFSQKTGFPASSSEITSLQKILSAFGYMYGDIDGKYTWDGLTQYSVGLFQKDNNLYQNGIAGQLTVDALKEKWNSKCASDNDTTPSITVLSPKNGDTFVQGKPIIINILEDLYLAKIGLVLPDFNPNINQSDSNSVYWMSVYSDAGKNLIWDGSSFVNYDGSKNYFNAGTGNYKILAVRNINDCYKDKISSCVYDLSDTFIITPTATPFKNDFICGAPLTEKLESGMSGGEVYALQKILNGLIGYLKDDVNGNFGSSTVVAVKRFQYLNGLTVDGKVGPDTRAVLNAKWAEKCVGSSNSYTKILPTIIGPVATYVTPNGVTLSANITYIGTPSYTEKGFCYRAYGQASRIDNVSTCKKVTGTGTGPFSLTLTELTPSTTYNFIGYASHEIGPAMTTQGIFTTTASGTNTPPLAQCSDGIDNDNDGKMDAGDPQCYRNSNMKGEYVATHTSERYHLNSAVECGDKNDNDNDGFIDVGDKGCHVGGLLTGDYVSTNSEKDPVFNILEDSISCGSNSIINNLYFASVYTEQVKSLQTLLNKLGYLDSSKIDGKYGSLTKFAVQQFQIDNNLKSDGIVGSETRSVINTKMKSICTN